MRHRAPARHRHSGGENLEVMQEAEKYNRFLRDLIRRYAGDAPIALDFGAGIGTFSDSLDIPADRMHCVEPDAAARQLLASEGFLPHADLSDVDDACVAYLFTLNVLEHIEDDIGALSEMYRVLEPGGRVFVYVPAFNLLYSSMDSHVGHHRRYRMASLAELMERVGFTIEAKAYTDALGFFATLAYKLVNNREPAPLNRRMVRLYDRYLFPLSRILSVPLARILGKNLFIVATRPVPRRQEQQFK